MESKVCMNGLCGASLAAAGNHKKGWALRSGGFATLCDKCGSAYEQLAFCEQFHLHDTGWRECTSCGKRLHCGCIASSAFLELLDSGGVSCISCSNSLERIHNTSEEKPKEFCNSVERVRDPHSTYTDNHVNVGDFGKIMLKQLGHGAGVDCQKYLLPSENNDASRSLLKHQESLLPSGDNGTVSSSVSTLNGTSETARTAKFNNFKENMGLKDARGSLVQTNLTIGLAASSGKQIFFPGAAVEERELNKTFSSYQQGPWARHILPKVPKPNLGQGFDPMAGINSQIRIARPPVEGRIKNQLLPRYWPRITEEELQQISGDSNATIVPLFEKVLSASDAGRIGRLVLPKACAEAYFPSISQPEGLPLKIQDVKGKEWLFQFRFWPNNNSRMYVLEGVTPCIQSMQLQAGDTVTFSRMEPEGKLLMGFRKASISTPVQSLKGSADSHLHAFSRTMHIPNGDASWHTNEKLGSKSRGGPFPPSMLVPEKKRSRTIGSKSKRLLIESQDALELKHTWEELQDILCPASNAKPSTVTIEDYEFEEFEEPPVFGKGSLFTVQFSGEQVQWAQCDNCSKWRRLPADFLLPPKWTCQENVWDPSRSACMAPDELSPQELENLLRLATDFHKKRNSVRHRPEQEQGLDTPTASTAMGENPTDLPVATTTKHPRHRPGCSCIVCIQPPSGKGKHKPTCTCNVCMTVKRRFKTLMLRKKKRQSEREAEIAEKNQLTWGPKEEAEVESVSRRVNSPLEFPDNELRLLGGESSSKGHLDLNIHPHREEENQVTVSSVAAGTARVSMMSLLQVANQPLETYLKQNGLTSLISDQQASSSSQALQQATGETEGGGEGEGEGEGDHHVAPAIQEDGGGEEEENQEADAIQDTCS